jgi:hypothetical protein
MTVSVTPTNTPLITATGTAMPTPTRRPTQPPRPIHLPIVLRDPPCNPITRYSDVVFVQDVSKYMLKIHDGKESRELADHYLRQMAGLLDFAHARVALVRFTDQVWVEQELTNNRALFLTAVGKEPLRSTDKTRMDLALRVAGDRLNGPGATAGNGKVIIFISELQAKSVPWENVPGCVEKRGEECAVLAAAREVRARGVTIYVWATSNANDGGQMLWGDLASDTANRRFLLPTDADIARTLGSIQVVVPCAPELFWPRRRP